MLEMLGNCTHKTYAYGSIYIGLFHIGLDLNNFEDANN